MDGDENDARDGLGGLRDAELFDKDEDADYGERAHDLNEDVDYVARASFVRSVPDEQAQH